MVFFARSPRMRDLSYFQCQAMLGERAQEKTTAPPTLRKETIEVNHYQRSQKTRVGCAQLGDQPGRPLREGEKEIDGACSMSTGENHKTFPLKREGSKCGCDCFRP